MPSWQVEPERLAGAWWCFRQVAPGWAPLYHSAGEPVPTQPSARWHRAGAGYAQYLALEPLGAWAELVRYERIRGPERAAQHVRRLWQVLVGEREIADLATFERYERVGLDPRIAVGDHAACQDLADELRAAGFRGILSPSAALVGATNLTLFGARYEKVLLAGLPDWRNPDPDHRLACALVVEGTAPVQLVTETVFLDMPHEGYRAHLAARGLPIPPDAP